MIRLSTPSKMRGTCKTWSLEAIETCPAAIGDDGKLVPSCASCYATKGFYHMPTVKAPRAENKIDWQRDNWVPDMVKLLARQEHFRFFDSGDMYSVKLAEKIYQIVDLSPHCKFWIPTKMHKFEKFAPIIAKLEKLENCVVRKSSDSITGKKIAGKNSSTIISTDLQTAAWHKKTHICPATVPANKANCKANKCTACWDKDTKVIAYHFH